MNSSSPLLVAQQITQRVRGPEGDLTLLNDITLEVDHGDSLAIIGPSGSGKSTLLSLLAGLDTPSEGEILLRGSPFSALDEDARAQRRGQDCGFVFQQFHLVDDLTAQENVMLPLEILGRSAPARTAQQWLENVGLAHRRQHYPSVLSGGEQQRVALARAFAVNPALLFADEPTGSLDHANGQAVADLLFSLNKEHGTALILVTHDAELAARCQRQVTLIEGRVHG